jgi:PhnB protein
MAQINPHINFNGNAEEAFLFYQSVFGGTFSKIIRFKEMAGPGFSIPKNEEEKLMHIALPIGNNMLMGNDVPSILGTVNEQENRSKIAIKASTKEEADHLFNGLSKDGQVEIPLQLNPDGSYFGMFRDKYGIEWMINVEA